MKFGGLYPYVVRTSQNNGIRNYITENVKFLNPANTISFGQDTATIFYQDRPYFTGDKIKIMTLKNGELNAVRSCYFLSAMRKAFINFQWGQNSFDEEILANIRILLPATSKKEIAFDYMERVIRELEEERIRELEEGRIRELAAYLKVSDLESTELTEGEKSAVQMLRNGKIKWSEFSLAELFTCRTGDVDVQRKHLNGKGTMYINSGITNCGVIGKTDYPASIFPQNTITIDMFGNAYYRDFEYKMATHAHVFSLSNIQEKLNEKNGLFICASLSYFQKLFSFSDMCNWTKMSDMKIYLPISSTGSIDWDFMETLITAEARLAIRGVIEWKDKVIAKTKELVAE